MTNGIYAKTLVTIGGVIALLDRIGDELDDAGIALEDIVVNTADGERVIGRIQFDDDGHPFFVPQQLPNGPLSYRDSINWNEVYAELEAEGD